MRGIMISKTWLVKKRAYAAWSQSRSQAIKAIVSSLFARHPSDLASESQPSFCLDVLDVVFLQRLIRK